MGEPHLRLAAYAVCRDVERLLLARYVSPDRAQRHWTLPGGRVEHGEDPYDAVVREVQEETGYLVHVEELLGVSSWVHGIPGGVELHRVGIVYRARPVSGGLRPEVDGSTDLAAWVPVGDVPRLARSVIVDVALALARDRPPTGHVAPVEVTGLLRD